MCVLKILTDKLKFYFVSYFSMYMCPDRFSLTNEQAKKNDFYEVHIYIPDASNEEISRIPKRNIGALDVKCEFIPSKSAARWGGILSGRMRYSGSANFTNGYLSSEYLRYSRIDVNYYFGHWDVREQDCSVYTLLRLFLLRYIRVIYLSVFKYRLSLFVKRHFAYRKLGSPLRSKYEIYEALMNSDDFLKRGSFRKSQLSKALFGNHYMGEYSIYQKVSKSLDWILDACVQDGEIVRVGSQDDPLYEMKGKGIHYFTLTKEHIKNEEANKRIQQRQIKIQHWMIWLTVFLVIGTFLSAVDKIEKIKELGVGLIAKVDSLVVIIVSIFI